MMQELHKLQAKVLQELAHHKARRFSELMAVTELTSDDFKFHLRKLIKLGLVSKNDDGGYELTTVGKETANRFDYEKRVLKYQPKLTTVVYVRRKHPETGVVEYLFQQRLRQPFYGYWGVIGEPVLWGETFEQAATRGLLEQTGLTADILTLKGFYRQRDQLKDSHDFLEDKLFAVMLAQLSQGELHDWEYAKNQWLGALEAAKLPGIFESCLDMLATVESENLQFGDNLTAYAPGEY